jgi:hypothetical protein
MQYIRHLRHLNILGNFYYYFDYFLLIFSYIYQKFLEIDDYYIAIFNKSKKKLSKN